MASLEMSIGRMRRAGLAMLAVGCAAAVLSAGTSCARAADADPAAAMRDRFASAKVRHVDNPFGPSLYLDSSEAADRLAGDVLALVDHPFAAVRAALDEPSQWCEILILHLNIKYCRGAPEGEGRSLQVRIGSKYDQPLAATSRLDFAYRVAAETASFLQVILEAPEGPMGTRDYRIVVEAAPADEGHSFIHLSYSYAYGAMARLAMRAYLGTVGSDKVGFTVVGKEPDGAPHYIGGVRGVVERNTMRYYLAIEAYLGASSAPSAARMEKSLRDWFSATELHPRQLHELERHEYLDMKRREYSRQRGDAAPGRDP